jgi:uncharacterized lipoprotein YajG
MIKKYLKSFFALILILGAAFMLTGCQNNQANIQDNQNSIQQDNNQQINNNQIQNNDQQNISDNNSDEELIQILDVVSEDEE